MVKIFRQYGIFLLIPLLVLIYSVFIKLAAGPYWLAPNFDPSYQYLINGLYLIKGFVPNHTDHPGTPLQLLCCAIDWLFNLGKSPSQVVTNVLTAPEFYLSAAHAVILLFSFFTSVALAVYVFRKTNDHLAALLTQLPAISFLVVKSWETFEPILPVVANVSPEPLLIGILNLFNGCLLMNFFAKTSNEESVSTLWWGFACGLGVAVKLTFMPLLAVPLIILSWKNKALFTGVFTVSFVLWTLPIISKYPVIWGWVRSIFSHTTAGNHTYHGVLAGVVLVTFSVIIWKLTRTKWSRKTIFLTAILAGIILQFAVVTQHPGAHYLLPGLGLFSALFVVCYWPKMAKDILGRQLVLAFILMSVIAGAWLANGYRLKLEGLTQGILAFHDQVSVEHQNCMFIDYYRSSDQGAALFFGDGWNLSPHLGQELFRLYPNKFCFNLWSHGVSNFNGRVWTNDLLAQNACVLFRGDGNVDFSQGPYEVKLLEKGRFESIHRLIGTTEKQAAVFFAGAMQFIQTGDYIKALTCALQARKFHYQPDSSVESLITFLRPYLQH